MVHPVTFYRELGLFGDVLNSEGYEQTVMIGADARFGGLSYLFENHGNYKVMDYNYANKKRITS